MSTEKIYFLEGTDIGLRTLEEADADGNYRDWFNDGEVCKYNSHHRFAMAKEELLDFIRSSHSSQNAFILAEGEEIQRIYSGKIPLLLNYSRRFLPEFHSLRKEIGQYGKFLKGVGYYGKGILHNGSHSIRWRIIWMN